MKSRTRADRIYAALKAGSSFPALTRKYSLDPGSKNQGGRLTIGKGQTVPAFDGVAFSLRTGQISRPVRTWVQVLKAEYASKVVYADGFAPTTP